MYFDTYIEYQYQIRQEMIEKEMHNYKTEAVRVLGSIIVQKYKTNFLDSLIQSLAYCFMDNLPDAETIANKLNLNKLHFLAVLDMEKQFEEEFIKDMEIMKITQDFK